VAAPITEVSSGTVVRPNLDPAGVPASATPRGKVVVKRLEQPLWLLKDIPPEHRPQDAARLGWVISRGVKCVSGSHTFSAEASRSIRSKGRRAVAAAYRTRVVCRCG